MSEKFTSDENNSGKENFDLEAALGDVDNDLDLVKEYGFSETNRLRIEKGEAPYTQEEYDTKFLEMHQNSIKYNEDSIKRANEEIERYKNQLDTNDNKVAHLKEILANALKDGDSSLAGKAQKTLEAWQQTFSTDVILDKISNFQKRIEIYEESINHSKSILEKLNQKL